MLKIRNAYCKNQLSPAVVGDGIPFFSWQLESDRKGCFQRSFRILLKKEDGLIWDSGEVISADSQSIAYGGPALQDAQEYTWQVRVTDQAGDAAWSEPQRLWAGLGHWEAKWVEPIALPQLPENPLVGAMRDWQEFFAAFCRGERKDFLTDTDIQKQQPLEPYDPTVMLKTTFTLPQGVKAARAYVTAHGIYTLRINGHDAHRTQLNPGFTTYDIRLKYQIYDVAELLRAGENEIIIEVADGWYKGKIALGRGCEYGEVPGALMELRAEHTDGTVTHIRTGEGWAYSYDGPVRMADLYRGQYTDARATMDRAAWKPAVVKPVDESVLEAQEHPGIVVFREVTAQRVFTTPKGETVVDFGQNLAGHLRVILHGCLGETLQFEHGETLDKDGNFFYIWNSDMTREQKDTYVCAGTGEEIFEPVYTYHGFRYVRVKGGLAWKPEHFTAMAISSDNRVTGTFEADDPRLNQLESNITWSQRSNMVGIPTDCPTREKAGWTGDVFIYGATSLWHQDLTAFYRDWLRSVRAEQLPNGGVQNTVPLIKNYVQQVGMTSMGWGDVILTLPWQLYTLQGEKEALRENYHAMRRWMARVVEMCDDVSGVDMTGMTARQQENQHYLINTGFHFGDWLVPSIRNEQGFSDGPLSSVLTMKTTDSAIVAFDADLFAEVAHILGETEDESTYRAFAKRVREAFAEEMCTPEGLLKQELQGNYILALHYDMIPREKRPAAIQRLRDMIVANDYRLDTGFMSVPHLLDTLCDLGDQEMAWRMVNQNQCPGWMYEVEHGATTMWESWDCVKEDGSVSDQSLNHYAFGCVGDYLYRRILGIQNQGLGYDRVRLAPGYACGLRKVRGSHDCPYGEISLAWEKTEEGYRISGHLPPNTAGTLVLPDGTCETLENGAFEIEWKGAVA